LKKLVSYNLFTSWQFFLKYSNKLLWHSGKSDGWTGSSYNKTLGVVRRFERIFSRHFIHLQLFGRGTKIAERIFNFFTVLLNKFDKK